MFKKYSKFSALILFGIFNIFVTTASAIDLDEATRTVVVDESGKTTVLTPEQVKRGKRLFNATCGACHVGGITKTNPNVGLDPEALSLATPRRDNIVALVDYMKNPVTYEFPAWSVMMAFAESAKALPPVLTHANLIPPLGLLVESSGLVPLLISKPSL